MKERTELEKWRIQRVIDMNPDNMPLIQKVCWFVIVWCEWRIRKIEKKIEGRERENGKTNLATEDD